MTPPASPPQVTELGGGGGGDPPAHTASRARFFCRIFDSEMKKFVAEAV